MTQRLAAGRVLLAILLCLSFLNAVALAESRPSRISSYRPVFKPCREGAEPRIAIREFEQAGVRRALVVDPATLAATVVDSVRLDYTRPPTSVSLDNTPYLRAIRKYTSLPHRLQNDGATRASRKVAAMFLTVDLCPSKHADFEPELMQALDALSAAQKRPIPVNFAITGLWTENHRHSLARLIEKVRGGVLDITWMNHSFSHPFDSRLPFNKTFLLTAGLDFRREIFAVEQMLLEEGLVPSPFFRFPGLVSDERLMGELRELSLIPIGSDAWLAKGERPAAGSFILIHGNGNEPKGIKLFLDFLLTAKGVEFAPLRSAFTDESPR